jgi:AraC-like DNA-binding protein
VNQIPRLVKGSNLIGERTVAVSAERVGKLDTVGINFFPEGFYHFFKIPLHQLTNQIVSLSDWANKEVLNLESQLFDYQADTKRFEILNQYFLSKLNRLDSPDNYLPAIIQAIQTRKGNVNIQQLSQDFQVNYKTLERKFQAQIGINPKTFARIIRFKNVYQELIRPADTFYDFRFLDFGYYDQNHFIKEFKFFLGSTPTEYFTNNTDFSYQVLQVRTAY